MPPTPDQVVLVVDFGAQYAQLIARRVREAHVYSEIVPHTITRAEIEARRPAGLIFSGGPASVHVEGAPRIDEGIYDAGVPVLGICYGAQLMALQLGGEVARTGQRHDTGAKMFHRAPRTTSTITAKSVSLGTGRADYRGWVDLPATVSGCRSHTECDALLVDAASRSDTYPAIRTGGTGNIAQHEASVSRLSAEQIFYMQQRGLSEAAARGLSINGFISNLVERFPLQYSSKIKRLIELQMTGSVG